MNRPKERPDWANRLRDERLSRNWTQEHVVRAMRAASDRPLPEDLLTNYKRYERGTNFPASYATLLAAVFDTDTDSLFGSRRRVCRPTELLTTTDAGVVDRVDKEEDDVRRRNLLSLLGHATVTHQLVVSLEGVRNGLDRLLAVAPTDRDADDWEEVVAAYAVSTVPAAQRLVGMVSDFAEIERRVVQATGLLRTKLVHSGAQLAILTAMGLSELRQRPSAQRWWRTASRAAEATHDPQLIAKVLAGRAFFELNVSSTTRVLSLADEAIARGPNLACFGVIQALSARTQQLSAVGRHPEASAALHQIVDMFGQLPASTTTDQHNRWGWSEQRLRHVESYVHAYAGRLDDEHAAHDAAAALYPAERYVGRTQVSIHRSITMIRVGNVDGGATHLMAIFDGLTAPQRSNGDILQRAEAALATVPNELRRRTSVREAVDAVRTSANA